MEKEATLFGPGDQLKLLENTKMGVNYIPLEPGRPWQDFVLPADHMMVETIILASSKGTREVNIPGTGGQTSGAKNGDEEDEDEDEDDISTASPPPKPQDRSSNMYRTNYQITMNAQAHRYSIILEFPRGSRFSVEAICQIYNSHPNRIIQAESEPFVSPYGLQGFRWTVTMDGWTIYSRADIIFLHSDPRLQTVTHVFPETIGRNNEGKGIKRQRDEARGNKRHREDEELGEPVVGRKTK